MKRILLIEDDVDMADIVRLHLEECSHTVDIVGDGDIGLEVALEGKHDLLILDLMLPGKNGLEICKEVRKKELHAAILMLTRKSDDVDKVLGLEVGADDYLTKPFSILELVARVKALLRRIDSRTAAQFSGEEPQTLQIGGLTIDFAKRKVMLHDQTVALTATEFELLSFLASNEGEPFSRGQLLEAIWQYGASGYGNTVSTHINRLRGKIESDPTSPRFIRTVWGVGYRFAERQEIEQLN